MFPSEFLEQSKLAFGDDDERVKVVSDYSESLIIYSTDVEFIGTRQALILDSHDFGMSIDVCF